MSIYPRPIRFESFTLTLALVGASAALGCSAPPQSAADGSEKAPASEAKTPAAKANADADAEPAPPADDGCCKYCFDKTPCGDACIDKGKTCDKPEGEGCACDESKRVAKTFRKGWQPRPNTGLVRPDVWNYNKAQGDPIDGPFTLEMAFEGAPELADKSKGKLTAEFVTSMGSFECELFEDKAPLTVANFVGLARGVRPYQDPTDRKSDDWVKGPYYDGTIFHRVIEDFMVQGGDPSKSGRGTPGYFIPDEFHPDLRHSGPGIMSMANRNPYDKRTQKPIYDEKTGLTVGNTGSAQFFVTVRKTEALNDRHTVFGRCDPKVPIEISKVKTQSRPIPDKPIDDVTIETIKFSRK